MNDKPFAPQAGGDTYFDPESIPDVPGPEDIDPPVDEVEESSGPEKIDPPVDEVEESSGSAVGAGRVRRVAEKAGVMLGRPVDRSFLADVRDLLNGRDPRSEAPWSASECDEVLAIAERVK